MPPPLVALLTLLSWWPPGVPPPAPAPEIPTPPASAAPPTVEAVPPPAETCPLACACVPLQVIPVIPVGAESPPPTRPPLSPSAVYRPHRGLSVTTQLGIGHLRSDFAGMESFGRTFPLAIALGLAAAGNLIVSSDFYYAHAFAPISNYHRLDGFTLRGFGPGLKYFFKSTNVFLSGSLLLSQFRTSNAGTIDPSLGLPMNAFGEESHWGLTGRLSVGREWWLFPQWSVGLAGEAVLGRLRNISTENGNDFRYTTRGFSLLFSSTVNYPPSPAPARSEATAEDASVHAHDGVYVNARLGAGWLWSSNSGGDISGHGTPFGLSVGHSLNRNLVLFADFFETSLFNADYGWSTLAELDLQGYGPGFKYYFMPANIFVSGAMSFSKLRYHSGAPIDGKYGSQFSSGWGSTGRLAVGKEWWVSSDWGLGLSAEALLGRMTDTVKGLSFLASASFN